MASKIRDRTYIFLAPLPFVLKQMVGAEQRPIFLKINGRGFNKWCELLP